VQIVGEDDVGADEDVAPDGREQGVQLVGGGLPLVGCASGAIFQGGRSGSRSASAVEQPHHQDRITCGDVVDGRGESPEKPAPVRPATTVHAKGLREISSQRA